MEKKKINFGNAAANVGKATTGLFENAKKAVVDAVDQNGDGRIKIDDISVVTSSVKNAVKETGNKWNERQEEKRRQKQLAELCPVFADYIDSADFVLPKLIRISERDKKHEESDVCQGSVGHFLEAKELKILNIYRDKAAAFGLNFYPNLDSEIYYVDPSDRDHYIALDSYFTYLKMARANELQQIAQKLGAKHFRVTLMEEKKETSQNKAHAKAGLRVAPKQSGHLDGSHEKSESTYQKIGIAAEMDCPGHEPERPELVYLQKDLNVQNLIELRMAQNALTHQKVSVSFTQSSGIKIKDAMKIDAALIAMKAEASATITNEAEKESRRLFEYEIDF